MKTALGVIGLVLLVASVYLGFMLTSGEKLAVSKDDTETQYGMIEGPLPCSWEVVEPERVMGEDKSQAVAIDVQGLPDAECVSTISLRAPGFDISPREEEQSIALAGNQKGSLSWIVSPRKTGSYEIAVADALNTKILGITVTDTFGLTALQAKIASVVGALFGPMLTVPWWWEKLRNRKKDDKKER